MDERGDGCGSIGLPHACFLEFDIRHVRAVGFGAGLRLPHSRFVLGTAHQSTGVASRASVLLVGNDFVG
jgi:hypothetical protein